MGRRRPATIAAADGPLATRKARYQDPLVDAYLAGAQEMGYALNDDYNGAEQDGFARMQMTIRDGHRESAATAYLHPVLSRENLTVRVNSLVTRVVIEGTRAIGVEYIHKGERRFAAAEREVILCGRRDQFAAAANAVRHRRPGRIVARTTSR